MGAVNIRNLHGHVALEQKGQIVHATLRRGDAFPCKRNLAKQAAISHTLLREVIRMFSTNRWIEARPKVGTRTHEERSWHKIGTDVISLFSFAKATLVSYFVLPTPKCSNLKYSLPYHHKVFEAKEHLQSRAARRAMQHMTLDLHAVMTGKYRIRKPV